MKELTGRMTDRNWELVPHSRNLVRERTLTTELCAEGWYSEHSGVLISNIHLADWTPSVAAIEKKKKKKKKKTRMPGDE